MINKLSKVVSILSVLITIILSVYTAMVSRENTRLGTVVNTVERRYQDAQGRHIMETSQWTVRVREMERLRRKDTSLISAQQREIVDLYNRVRDVVPNAKNVESATAVDIKSESTHTVEYVKDTNCIPVIPPIVTPHLNLTFTFTEDRLTVNHVYRNKLYVVLDRRKERENGDYVKYPRLPWHWGKEWLYKASVTSEDTSATIEAVVHVNFE